MKESCIEIMWILNITPDSFFDGGKYTWLQDAKKQIDKMISEGVDVIDVWGFSSRPWAKIPSIEVELSRIIPILELLEDYKIAVSVDTCRHEIIEKILKFKNLKFINDISGLQDEKIPELLSGTDMSYILMHTQWIPWNMQKNPKYGHIIEDISSFFEEKIQILRSQGIENIILDPGFGFWKTIENNYEILKNLDAFHRFWLPLLTGVSRKSMIYKLLEILPKDALPETSALHLKALEKWSAYLRVHDVQEAKNIVNIYRIMSSF